MPGADTGHSFPLSSPAADNSAITVTVDGKPTEVLGAVGFSDSLDCYQVNFRVRPETVTGAVAIQVGVTADCRNDRETRSS